MFGQGQGRPLRAAWSRLRANKRLQAGRIMLPTGIPSRLIFLPNTWLCAQNTAGNGSVERGLPAQDKVYPAQTLTAYAQIPKRFCANSYLIKGMFRVVCAVKALNPDQAKESGLEPAPDVLAPRALN